LRRFAVTRPAQADLRAIWQYVALDSVEAADRLIDRISELFPRLAQFPEMGSARDAAQAGMRSFPVGSYVIFYRRAQRGVQILRVLHGARDIGRVLQ